MEKLLSESAEKMTKLQEERDKSALTQINLTKITQDFDELRKLLLEQDNVIKKIKSKNKQVNIYICMNQILCKDSRIPFRRLYIAFLFYFCIKTKF